MNAFVIRKAVSDDLEALMRLLRECVSWMRAGGIEQWDEIYPNRENMSADIAAGTLDVLCDKGGIVACITIDQNMDPLWKDLDWNPDGVPAAVVHRLMVRPSCQGQGIAKQLMRHAEHVAAATGCRSIRLDSFLQNPAAMALYSHLGYRRTGIAMMRKGEFAGFERMTAGFEDP